MGAIRRSEAVNEAGMEDAMKQRCWAAVMAMVAMLAVLAPANALIRDAEMEAVLHEVAKPILDAAGFAEDEVKLSVWGDGRVNAFATGDNRIVLFSGLVEAAENYGELAAVIAHEAAHLAGGHVVRRAEHFAETSVAASALSLLAVIAATAGTNDPGAALGGLAATQHVAERTALIYTRDQEAAADAQAVLFMDQAGLDPVYLADFLGTLAEDERSWGDVDPYTQSHPLSSDRISTLQRQTDNFSKQFVDIDPGLQHRFERVQAKLHSFLGDPAEVLEKLDPSDSSEIATLQRAVALHRLGRHGEAIAEVDRLVGMHPEDPYHLELKGQIQFESGQTEEAVVIYRQVLSQTPDEALIKVGLAQALLALQDDASTAEALEVLEDAVRRDSLNAPARYFLAQALARKGNLPRANLMTAEQRLILGDLGGARRFAERTIEGAGAGTPEWFRANDILGELGVPVEPEKL